VSCTTQISDTLLYFGSPSLPTDFSKPINVDLPISHAGAFVYWVEYDGARPGERVKGREGYFNIDPILRTKARSPILSPNLTPLPTSEGGAAIQSSSVNLPLDGLAILTVVSKWMGPLSGWREYFNEAKDRGYTMLHWTPLQERGESESPYSIRNQLVYEPSMFDDRTTDVDEGRARVEEVLRIAREEYGLLSLTDVVLNHTANDSPWLADHPEAGKFILSITREILTSTIGYSPANSPHLTPALELDTLIMDFSASLPSKGLPITVTSEQDVDTLVTALHEQLKALNMWEYYVLDINRERASVEAALRAKVIPWRGPDVADKSVVELAEIMKASGKVEGLGQLAKRYGVRITGGVAAGLVKAAFMHLGDNVEALADAWVKVVDVINVPLYAEWEEDTKVAIDHVKNRIKYTRLAEDGPKLGKITRQ
jgi:glycogen debranching enzyme